MQFRKLAVMLTALGAVSVSMMGCPEGTPQGTTCSDKTDCLESEICHPDAKVCVQTCTTSEDCPDTATNCEALGGTSADAATLVCKCSSTEACNNDRETADLVCATLDEVCVTKCSTNTDCGAGRACDTTTGQCKMGDCVANPNICTAEQLCNTTTKQCETAKVCDATKAQPDVCSYGQVCGSTNRCAPAPEGGNCTQATGAPAWNKTGGTAPVIVSVVSEAVANAPTSMCAGGGPAGRVTINFYAPGGLTTHSSSYSDMQNHVKARIRNSTTFIGPSNVEQHPVANATSGSMILYYCGPSTATGAIYIANESGQTSNVVCTNW